MNGEGGDNVYLPLGENQQLVSIVRHLRQDPAFCSTSNWEKAPMAKR